MAHQVNKKYTKLSLKTENVNNLEFYDIEDEFNTCIRKINPDDNSGLDTRCSNKDEWVFYLAIPNNNLFELIDEIETLKNNINNGKGAVNYII